MSMMDQTEMTASPLQLQEVYNQRGFLSALPVLTDAELKEARKAFSELETKFGRDLGCEISVCVCGGGVKTTLTFVCFQVKTTPSTASTMFISSIPG